MQETRKGHLIGWISLLLILCICSFLFAKYIIWKNIDPKEVPIDTSTRI